MSAKILWASQTGNCEEISLRLQNDCSFKGIKTERYCLQELGSSLKLQTHEVLVIIVSSTGDGELPDNGQKFYRWIRQQEGTILSGIRYTILGLGDSNYSTFQGGPKTVEKHLKRLGACEFYGRGEADEQMGLENTVEYWIDSLWGILEHEVAQLANVQRSNLAVFTEETRIVQSKILGKRLLSEKNTLKAIIELRLTIDQTYTPGTAILMYPQNNRDKVNLILSNLKLSPDHFVTPAEIPKFLSHRCKSLISLTEYFARFIDINSPLKSSTATYMASLLQDSDEKNDLISCIDESKISMPAAYTLECITSQYSSWGAIQFEEFLQHLPVLSARNYSISTSPINSPNTISIVFTVTGLCTRYMNSISDFNNHVLEFSLPSGQGSFWQGMSTADKALIISTGTGISPFKGILEHLLLTEKKPVWVLYGCRNSIRNTPEQNFDHIYYEEVVEMVKRLGGKISIANSKSPIGPKHVQDILDEQEDEIRRWSKVALLCGSFRTKEISAKLSKINPEFQVFTEEWD